MSGVPPISANPHTEIEIEDSCNCCWGRRVKKKPSHLKRRDASADLFADQLEHPIRDANEVYNLNISVHVDTPKESHDRKHTRAPTTYPKATESVRISDKHTETKS